MKSGRQNGFSIIEAILGIVIISSCFLSLVNVMTDSTLANIKIDFLSTSVLLARGKMSEVMAKDFDSISGISDISFGGDFSNYNYSIIVNYVSPSDLDAAATDPTDYKKIIVSVSLAGRPDTINIANLKVKIQ